MIKKYIKIGLIVLLSLVILFEIGYIIKINVLKETETKEVVSTPTPEPLPVVGGVQPQQPTPAPTETVTETEKIIVIDPGHGKPSSLMTDDEKRKSGWVKNRAGEWGEWRHYKTGTADVNCEGAGCNKRVPPNGACWYPIGNSDRNTEPDINLQNALAAKKQLEKLGYIVRLTRTSNEENPSITKRLSYCYPDNDTTKAPDAKVYISIHSNASGGTARGSAYIKADGIYDQKWIPNGYVEISNELGSLCNKNIVDMTSLIMAGNGEITWEPELITLCKSPVPCGYLEIGFFDNASDLKILKSETDKIGEAIAKGVDEFCKTH